MGNPASHYCDSEVNEQGSIRDGTGFDDIQHYVFVEEISGRWKEFNLLDVLLLRAICRLSTEHPQQAKSGFTPMEIAEVVRKFPGNRWTRTGGNKELTSKYVREQWNSLQSLWESKIEGISQQFAEKGLKQIPALVKTEGGGTGNLSIYRINWILPTEELTTQGAELITNLDLPPGKVSYICEDIEDAGPVAKIFARGYFLSGWRKNLYFLTLAMPLVICFLLFIQVIFSQLLLVTIGPQIIYKQLFSLFVVYAAVWLTLGALFQLRVKRVVIAPWWMQSVDDDRLLEQRLPPRHESKSVKAVRYTATCPICEGKVAAKSGGLEFRGRIVGRCEEAPVEHVFSFDHITRSGKTLR